MQVKTLEYVQGRDIRGSLPNGTVTDVLEPEKVYDVDDALGAWLIENHKAEAVKVEEARAEPHYGSQAEPELRLDEEVYKEMKPRATKRSKKSEG
jgi:hypothetical protein